MSVAGSQVTESLRTCSEMLHLSIVESGSGIFNDALHRIVLCLA